MRVVINIQISSRHGDGAQGLSERAQQNVAAQELAGLHGAAQLQCEGMMKRSKHDFGPAPHNRGAPPLPPAPSQPLPPPSVGV